MSTFLIAGGGTGGHVIPGLAVARELRARGHRCVFIGTRRGAEARLVPPEGFEVEWIESAGLKRKSIVEMLAALVKLPRAVMGVRGRIGRERPGAMLSLGGYVAGPAVIAAIWKRLPLVTVEPNAMPGLVTRRTAKRVAKACVNFEETKRWFPPGRAVVTGVPVRQEFFEVDEKRGGKFTVLITGGSQGSRTLNRATRESWPLLKASSEPVRMILQCGVADADALRREFAATGLDGEVTPFINDVPAVFAQADMIVSRAGASTVAEICAAGKPSILVPFPFAADDHQAKNAEAMQKAGAARMFRDAEWSGEAMMTQISELRTQSEALREMGTSARRLAQPKAAQIIADILTEVADFH